MAFFGTLHGKGCTDGVGGLMKWKVTERVIQRKAIVKDEQSFFECSVQNLNIPVKFYFVSLYDIERFNSNALGSTFEDALELKGIKGAHSLYFHGGRILIKPYSFYPPEASITTSLTNSIECNGKSLQKKAIEVNDCIKIFCEQ